MKRKYIKPNLLNVVTLNSETILAGSIGGFDDNKTGQQGQQASEGGNPLPGNGTRSKWFSDDWELPEWWDDGLTVSEKLDF